MTSPTSPVRLEERERALSRIKKRRDLRTHAVVFTLVNTAIIGIWAVTDSGGFFWPLFPVVFWGIGLVMNAWDVYVSPDITDQDIDREISRMHR